MKTSWLASFCLVGIVTVLTGAPAFAQSQGHPTSVTLTDTTTFSVPYATNGRTRTWGYTWSTTGQLLTAKDPLSHTTTYTYNAGGYLQTVTNALSQTTTVTSSGLARRAAVDHRPQRQDYQLHLRHPWSAVDGDHQPRVGPSEYQFAYNAVGDVTQMTLPGGGYLQYAYDDARRVTTITNARGERRTFTYDANNDPLTETVSDASSTVRQQSSSAYDEIGRIIQSIGAGSGEATSLAYDHLGNLTSATDPLSHQRQNAFDPLNRIITATNPESQMVQVAYDGQDNLTSQTDGRSLTTTRVVDGFGETIQEVSPDRGTRTYTYDAAGNLTKLVDGDGEETDFAYDALNRRTAMTFPAGAPENVTYTYDQTGGGNAGVGRLTSVTEESGSTTLTYDAQAG